MAKNITKAEYAGFCSGVKRAVSKIKQLKLENQDKNIYIWGELIHNSSVIKELEDLGIHTINSLPAACSGICAVRTHGLAPETTAELQKAGFEIADLTCPDVKKVQKKVVMLAQEGYPVLILGNSLHPETAALKAYAQQYSGKVFIIENTSDLDKISEIIKKEKRAGAVIQTTQQNSFLQEIVSKLILMTEELKVFNTICRASAMRQEAVRALASKSDLMIVIGGANSANTRHLADIASKITNTIHIETADCLNLEDELIKNAENIGIAAGASTPDNAINDVIKKLNKLGKDN